MTVELEPVFNNEGYSINVDFEIDFSDVVISNSNPFKSPVKVKGNIANRAEIVTFCADAVFDFAVPCDRCLTTIEKKYKLHIEHILVTELNDEENDEFILIDSYSYDLVPLVSEDIFLRLPGRFLCKDDCKGLCPYCGINLNLSSCSCQKPGDPRLDVLRQLLDNSTD